jgi:hypothetical protein
MTLIAQTHIAKLDEFIKQRIGSDASNAPVALIHDEAYYILGVKMSDERTITFACVLKTELSRYLAFSRPNFHRNMYERPTHFSVTDIDVINIILQIVLPTE